MATRRSDLGSAGTAGDGYRVPHPDDQEPLVEVPDPSEPGHRIPRPRTQHRTRRQERQA